MVWFDDRLQYYNKMIDEVESQPTTKDQECIRLSMSQLASSVVNHAKQWVSVLGKVLHDSAKENLFGLRDMLDVSFPFILCLVWLCMYVCVCVVLCSVLILYTVYKS